MVPLITRSKIGPRGPIVLMILVLLLATFLSAIANVPGAAQQSLITKARRESFSSQDFEYSISKDICTKL